MNHPVRLLPLLALLCSSCLGPPGKRVTPTEYESMQRTEQAGAVSAQARGARAGREQDRELEQRGRKLVADREDVQHDLAEIGPRRERLQMEQASTDASEKLALRAAQLELSLARKELERFEQERRPLREAEDALALQRSADQLQDAREELAQLELMYSGAELGEGTAEIVLQRSRRQVARAEQAQALAERHSAWLREMELPTELARLEQDVARREVESANAERALAAGALSRAAALRDLDHEQVRLERRVSELERDASQLEADRRAAETANLGRALGDELTRP